MRVAVPTFGDRVSPRFDCAACFLMLTVDGDCVTQRQEVSAVDWTPHDRIHRLVELGVEVVICGGIDRWSAAALRSGGITLYAWVSGRIDDSLDALRRGALAPRLMLEDDVCQGECGEGLAARGWEELSDPAELPRGGGGLRRGRRRGRRDVPGDGG